MYKFINKFNESNSRLHKEAVLRDILNNAPTDRESKIFLQLLGYCYNSYITFGVKQVDNTGSDSYLKLKENVVEDNPWELFIELLEKLRLRELTGNEARDAIVEIGLRFSPENFDKICAAIIRRDMRCGFSLTTINKICKDTEYTIPVFESQLAYSCEGRPELKGIKRLEPKLDGVRALFFATEKETICFSRNGKVFENFGMIIEQIDKHKSKHFVGDFADGFVLDGEVVGKSFQALMREARRKTDAKADDSIFYVFDIIPIKDFLEGEYKAELRFRRGLIDYMMSQSFRDEPNIDDLERFSISIDLDTDSGKKAFETYSIESVEAGYEGIMIKDLSSHYRCKRSTDWMKWKPTITVDLQIVEFEEGTGKNVGRLGAFVCKGYDHGKFITVNCGSGFTDKERISYWKEKENLLGNTVEVMCDAITQNQDGSYSLRFPRFVRFRDDK